MNITLFAELFCLVFAVIYKVISLKKKDDVGHKHYTLMSELWVVGLVVTIAITQVDNKICEKNLKTIEVKSDSTDTLKIKKIK